MNQKHQLLDEVLLFLSSSKTTDHYDISADGKIYTLKDRIYKFSNPSNTIYESFRIRTFHALLGIHLAKHAHTDGNKISFNPFDYDQFLEEFKAGTMGGILINRFTELMPLVLADEEKRSVLFHDLFESIVAHQKLGFSVNANQLESEFLIHHYPNLPVLARIMANHFWPHNSTPKC